MTFSSISRSRLARNGAAFALLMVAVPLKQVGPYAALWTTPCIVIASLLIAWGAESAQFFVAQGFALAMLAWMQTLPEFAVEAILAWKQQTALLLANLTGALRLLTGLGWPMIYAVAAFVYRRRTGSHLNKIELEAHHSIQAAGLLPALLYALFVWWKGRLEVYDGCILIAIYAAYLAVLTRLPPEEQEGVQELEAVPRAIVLAKPPVRILAISVCFIGGGLLIYFTAEPFLGSLISVAAALGIPTFFVIQWLAPIVSEFPELASTFYFARQEENAGVALMNIASSNINQWTLLMAMLPIVLSLGHGSVAPIQFDGEQRNELLLTLGQSFLAWAFLLNMQIAWWEALTLFLLFAAQFLVPVWAKSWITGVFFVWTLAELLRSVVSRRLPSALDALILTFHADRKSA